MSIFDRRLKYVRCKTWDSTASSFVFPEMSAENPGQTALLAKPNTGVAFSGGGTRSAAATLGQLRGLNHLGLLGGVRYLSCVSGGAWAAVPFTYLPELWPAETFLGQHVAASEVTLDYLRNLDRNSYAHAVASSILLDDFLEHALRFAGDETFSHALGDTFLKPFEIDSLRRFFSASPGTVDDIRSCNPRMEASDFYLPAPDRPYLIVGSTLLRLDNPAEKARKIHFETTPMYVGTKTLHEHAGSGGQHIGGGYIEPFGFDSDAPERRPDDDGLTRVRLGAKRHRFTLSDTLGTTGAAPAEVLDNLGLDWLGFPELKVWSLHRATNRAHKAKEYEFGDGGLLENLGVMPLLMRGVERLVVFVNTKHPLKGVDEINDSMPPLFGQTPDFLLNHVFPQQDFEPLVEALLEKKKDHKTVMHRMRHRVLDNQHHGIEGGWETEVLWVYNERVEEWEDALPAEIRQMLSTGSLGSFPHYKTFFQNPPAVIDLSAKQVSLLAHLSCWNVVQQREEISEFLSAV